MPYFKKTKTKNIFLNTCFFRKKKKNTIRIFFFFFFFLHHYRCHHSLRVLNRIPKGAVIPVADALQRLIREGLDRGSELAWGRLLFFSYWGLRYPGESSGGRQVSLSTLARQQVVQFMENTDLRVV